MPHFVDIGFAVAVWAVVATVTMHLLDRWGRARSKARVQITAGVVGGVMVEVVDGANRSTIAALDPAQAGFDQLLNDAVSTARSVAITMREADRAARRRLP